MATTLRDLAAALGLEIRGNADTTIARVAGLMRAEQDCVSFFGDRRYRSALHQTRAGAVILAPHDAHECPVPALLSDNPYLAFARAAQRLHPPPPVVGGIHPTAIVAPSAQVHETAWIGPLSTIEDGTIIGPEVFIGPGCIIGADCVVGAASRLVARVTLCEGTLTGERVLLHPGCVIGREGFGFARDGERWVRIPQIGRVRLGHDVEIGANTAVDRGAIDDTVIADGAKIDNLIQIGHNVEVGENTAMAACSGISGSTRIGRNCTIAGAVGMAGHLDIGDNVHFTGMAMVTRSFPDPGVYSSGIPAMPSAEWRRAVARFRQLDALTDRVKRIEKELDAE